jgi:hypothetical protein
VWRGLRAQTSATPQNLERAQTLETHPRWPRPPPARVKR